jgi:alkanesulfonate monooxygenase SsuD/methylene tetrahydromethanopterin reductase-like flavin-dependent oxidoreductase (luciferase family)
MLVSIRYNFRNPKSWSRSSAYLYNRILDQIAWADEVGFHRVTLAEHHFLEEGFLPALMPVAAAIAARTRRILISTEIFLLPLHHPVRVAEDAAVVDIISAGRLELAVGAGYRAAEYAGFGLRLKERGGRMEECLHILRKCWTEEEFSFEGRYYRLENVRMYPKPVQKPGPRIILGGRTAEVARRAARLADGFQPQDASLWDVYYAELERLGRPQARSPLLSHRPAFVHVSHDPKAAWEILRPHAIYEVEQYRSWGMLPTSSRSDLGTSDESLLKSHWICTPDEAAQTLLQLQTECPAGTFSFAPLLAGMDPELAQSSLALMAEHVLPVLRGAQACSED